MTTVDDTLESDDYDEFGLLHENAAEWHLPFNEPPEVRRGSVEVAPGQRLSYIRWGADPPAVVYLHGGGQNAHTWDSVALALHRPAIAFDLPGTVARTAARTATTGPGEMWRRSRLPSRTAPEAAVVVGMSLGGATATHLAATSPDLCRRAVIVDVTPR